VNERIKLLVEQATTRIDPSAHDGECWDFDKEKFARLIVKECSNFLKDTLDDHFAAEQLEEHFGVEE
jgi:hypothetical protein